MNVAIATKCFGLMNHLKTKTYVKIVKCGFKMKENTMVSYSKIPIGQSRHTDPETSHESARKLDPTKLELIVLATIKSFPEGCISEQVEDLMYIVNGIKASSVTPRYRQLLLKNKICICGKRKASSGRLQQVMMSTEDQQCLNLE